MEDALDGRLFFSELDLIHDLQHLVAGLLFLLICGEVVKAVF